MRTNKVKRALKNGEVVIGTMISACRGAGVATMMATAGFDYVFIDMEHSTFDMETVEEMIVALKATDTMAFVRTPGLGRLELQRPLDAGADGLLVPQVSTVEEVRQIVNYMKYYPEGERGMALRRGHSDYAPVKAAEYMKHANEETMVVIQVESKTAMRDIEQLVSVPGVDAAFIGPADLSQSYGKPGQNEDPEIMADLLHFIEVCNKHGVAPGIHVYDMAKAKDWIDKGMRLICYSNDISMIVDTGTGYTRELKSYIKGRGQ
ncbi:MAG TPA: aldolase/citrate lyase family protein [Symbiobacteriaceae bacterium]